MKFNDDVYLILIFFPKIKPQKKKKTEKRKIIKEIAVKNP